MPRKYQRKLGSRKYKDYTEQELSEALQKIRTGELSQRAASETYNIARSTLQLNLKLGDRKKCHGGQTALSTDEEKLIVANLLTISEYGFPIDQYELRVLVKNYLDRKGVRLRKFQNNMPGSDWTKSFLKRNKELTVRFASNIKNARAEVSLDTLNIYFDNLEKELDGIPAENIYNYDESNLTDDPGKKQVITKRGCKYPERIIHSSKSSLSIMFCGNASGNLIPPYVVYRATNIYDSWTIGGPQGARYNRSKTGWFDACIFEDWFVNLLLPILKKQPGKKALIGDNLSSHLSPHVIDLCNQNDIKFICLPPNTTHLTQPLDVAYFRPLKMKWRKIIEDYKNRHACVVNKSHFPPLLKKLMEDLKTSGSEALKSGFRKCGIFPCDRGVVLERLPRQDREKLASNNLVNDSLLEFLQKKRYGDEQAKGTKIVKKTKLDVLPGRSIENKDVTDPREGTSKMAQKTVNKLLINNKKIKKVGNGKENIKKINKKSTKQLADIESDSESSISYRSLSEGEGDNWMEPPSNSDLETNEEINEDSGYVIVKYEKSYFPGQIQQRKKNECLVKTMEPCGMRSWKWPEKDDVLWYKSVDVMENISAPTKQSSRNIYDVPEMLKYKDFLF